jgi:cell division protein FtsW (lipid II flippase)
MTELRTPLALLLQVPEEARDWWTSFLVGETVGFDWLLFLIGGLFASMGGYAAYSAMLDNMVASNRHPANFRRLVVCFVLGLIIAWFVFVFRMAFGGLVAGILLALWLVLAVIFYVGRRPVTPA